MSFLQDILQVIIAPNKAFKQIVTNPKYLGALIILLLFIGVQIGYEYVQFSRTYTEQTFPVIFFNGPDLVNELPTYTNSSSWTGGSNVNLTDSNDYFNYSIYLQVSARRQQVQMGIPAFLAIPVCKWRLQILTTL